MLDTIVTVAPLLGILGTVLGIIDSFDLLSDAGIQNPQAVLGGIAQALITTAAGLTVAVISLLPMNYFLSRLQKQAELIADLATQLELASVHYQSSCIARYQLKTLTTRVVHVAG